MMRSFILMLLLSGCSTSVLRPVMYQASTLHLPPDPALEIETLNAHSTPDQVIKAWVATATAYRGWNVAVRKQVENSR